MFLTAATKGRFRSLMAAAVLAGCSAAPEPGGPAPEAVADSELGPPATAAKDGRVAGAAGATAAGGVGGSAGGDGGAAIDGRAAPDAAAGTADGRPPDVTSPLPLESPARLCAATPSMLAISHFPTTLESRASGMCVEGSARTAAAKLWGNTCGPGDAQRFKPVLMQDDCTFQLQARTAPTLCLDAGRDSGREVLQNDCAARPETQRWNLEKRTDGSYRIRTKDGRCLDLGAGAARGVPVVTKACDDSAAQSFGLPGVADAIVTPPSTTQTGGGTVAMGARGSQLLLTNLSSPAAVSGMTAQGGGWAFPRPGSYLELAFSAVDDNTFVLSLAYAAWLHGAGFSVTVDGAPVGNVVLPVTGDRNLLGTTSFAFPATKGTHRLRLSTLPSAIPYRIGGSGGNPPAGTLTVAGQPLPRLNAINEIAPAGASRLDVTAISDLYRFTLDRTLSPVGWNHPNNVAFLEYQVSVGKAGRYQLSILYSCESGRDTIGVYVYEVPTLYDALTYGKALAMVPLPATAKGAYKETAPVTIDLPAGVSKLRLAGRSSPYVFGYAVGGITFTAAP